jgi:hypothetical protein
MLLLLASRRRAEMFRTKRLSLGGLRVVFALILTSPLAGAQAQNPPSAGQMSALAQRIEALEAQLAATNAELQAIKAEQAKQESQSEKEAALAADETRSGPATPSTETSATERLKLGGVHVRLFGDVRLQGSDAKGGKTSFAMDDLDLFLNTRLSDELSALTDVNFHFADDFTAIPIIDRILLRYERTQNFGFEIGRFHTGIGYSNDAFHQGRWLLTTVDRPFFLEFSGEAGILPDRMTGVSASGDIPSGPLGLKYIAEFGSTATQRTLFSNEDQFIDENNGLGINLSLIVRPVRWSRFQAGFSFYRDRMSPVTSAGVALAPIGQQIYAAHALYQNPGFQFLNEVLLVRHEFRDGSGIVFDSPAFYSLLSKRFGVVRPFLRYQYFNASNNEPIFSDLGRRNGPAAGIRYDFSEKADFKAQYDHVEDRNRAATNGAQLQMDFTF